MKNSLLGSYAGSSSQRYVRGIDPMQRNIYNKSEAADHPAPRGLFAYFTVSITCSLSRLPVATPPLLVALVTQAGGGDRNSPPPPHRDPADPDPVHTRLMGGAGAGDDL